MFELENFHIEKAILSAGGITLEHGIMKVMAEYVQDNGNSCVYRVFMGDTETTVSILSETVKRTLYPAK